MGTIRTTTTRTYEHDDNGQLVREKVTTTRTDADNVVLPPTPPADVSFHIDTDGLPRVVANKDAVLTGVDPVTNEEYLLVRVGRVEIERLRAQVLWAESAFSSPLSVYDVIRLAADQLRDLKRAGR